MLLCDVNPYIRYVSQIYYKSSNNPVCVRDCRLFYIISGEGQIIIENQHYNLMPNSLFFCRSGSEYNIMSEEGLSIIGINFDLSQKFRGITEAMPPVIVGKKAEVLSEYVSDSNILNSYIFLEDASLFSSDVKKILREFNGKKRFYEEVSGAVLKEILTSLHRTELSESSVSSEAVRSVIQFINSNYQRDITNKELASLAGYHEYYLNRIFLKHTGRSMHNYILHMRICEAKQLILNTDLPCNVIAENVGFKNYTYFSGYFKKEFGISPVLYRSKFKNKI